MGKVEEALNYLKERVRDKIQSWRNRLLNHAGKEVFIKAFLNAIPNYVMHIFKLPSTWCKEINALIARFWWESREGTRKIHWKNWGTMTTSKTDGGYGFREMQSFNRAILANMAARVMSEPNALWVRVLKGLYFPNNSLMQASSGNRASWAWASLLEGRNVIQYQGIWTLGDGQTIQCFQDPWVPIQRSFRVRPRGEQTS